MEEWNNNPIENSTECDEFEIQEEHDDDDCILEEPEIKIKAKEAVEVFDKALKWAEREMVDQSDIRVLRKLKEMAIFKMIDQKKYQKKITDFF